MSDTIQFGKDETFFWDDEDYTHNGRTTKGPWISGVPRNAIGIPCKCGGYMDRVDCTSKQIKDQSCSRSYECCCRAFKCRKCGLRIEGFACAPEME